MDNTDSGAVARGCSMADRFPAAEKRYIWGQSEQSRGKYSPPDTMESVSPQLSQNPESLQEVERQRPSPYRYGLHRKMYHLADSDINVCFPISLTPLTRCSVTENQINTPGGFVIKEIQARFDYCWQESRVCGANSNPILRTNILADSMALSQSILNWETGV